MIHCKTKR